MKVSSLTLSVWAAAQSVAATTISTNDDEGNYIPPEVPLCYLGGWVNKSKDPKVACCSGDYVQYKNGYLCKSTNPAPVPDPGQCILSDYVEGCDECCPESAGCFVTLTEDDDNDLIQHASGYCVQQPEWHDLSKPAPGQCTLGDWVENCDECCPESVGCFLTLVSEGQMALCVPPPPIVHFGDERAIKMKNLRSKNFIVDASTGAEE